MNYESQAKNMLKSYDVQVLNKMLISDFSEAEKKLRRIESDTALVKAQVNPNKDIYENRLVRNFTEALDSIENFFQRTDEFDGSRKVNEIYVEEVCDIEREFFLSFEKNSLSGGVVVEASAKEGDDKGISVKVEIDSHHEIESRQVDSIARLYGIGESVIPQLEKILKGIHKCFSENECNAIQIDPLVLTSDEELIVLNGNLNIKEEYLNI